MLSRNIGLPHYAAGTTRIDQLAYCADQEFPQQSLTTSNYGVPGFAAGGSYIFHHVAATFLPFLSMQTSSPQATTYATPSQNSLAISNCGLIAQFPFLSM